MKWPRTFDTVLHAIAEDLQHACLRRQFSLAGISKADCDYFRHSEETWMRAAANMCIWILALEAK